MHSLIQLTTIPLILLVSIWLLRNIRALTLLASLLFWAQAALVLFTLYPVLSAQSPALVLSADFSVDRIPAMFAVLTQIVVASSMTHAHIFFQHDGEDDRWQIRIFYTCTTLFLVAMTSVFFCTNLGFLWIGVEATTLCSAPLVYFHRTKHSLEAAWKYLMICSVGIAFALFGTIFIFASSQHGASPEGSLNVNDLVAHGAVLEYPLLKLGFLFCLLGYGTKAGIFPLHSWLPDAHSEAPAPASAMLSGGLLNCALFAVWRISQVVIAAGHQQLIHQTLVGAGVLTVLVASLFLIRQHGIKRLFAYSSIENVGLMLTAIGLGSGPLFFILALNHSAAKVALFLLSGNIIQTTGTKALSEIRGLLVVNPYWTVLFVLASFAVTGAPPFGAFVAEWQLLRHATELKLWTVVTAMLVAIALSFISVTMHVGKLVCGTPHQLVASLPPVRSSIIPALLILVTLLCGITATPGLFW